MNPCRPQTVFLLATIIFGPLLILLTPPMQVPDEAEHLSRIWQLAGGTLIARNFTAAVPLDFVALDDTFRKLENSSKMRNPQAAYSPFQHLPTLADNLRLLRQRFSSPLSSQPTTRKQIANTAVYSPVAYLPQLVVAIVVRHCGFSVVALIYGCRFATLIVYALIGWLTLSLIPFGKWFVALTLTSPMALYEACGVSADGMTIAIAFLTGALLLRLGYLPTRRPRTLAIALALSAIALTLAKSAYLPLVLIILFLPTKRSYSAMIALACLASFVIWSAMVHPMDSRQHPDDSPPAQLQAMTQHPLAFAAKVLRTLRRNGNFYLQSYVADFGSNQFVACEPSAIRRIGIDFTLPTASLYIYLLIAVSVAIGAESHLDIPLKMRTAAAAAWCASVAMILIADNLLSTAVGADEIFGMQGRYFLPLAPLLLIAFHSRRKILNGRIVIFLICGYLIAAVVLIAHHYYQW